VPTGTHLSDLGGHAGRGERGAHRGEELTGGAGTVGETRGPGVVSRRPGSGERRGDVLGIVGVEESTARDRGEQRGGDSQRDEPAEAGHAGSIAATADLRTTRPGGTRAPCLQECAA